MTITVTTKWDIGDKVWSFVVHRYQKDVACKACHGEGGANIPGTGVRVECQDCAGTGSVEGQWHSVDLWFARIGELDFGYRHGKLEPKYKLTGYWADGQCLGYSWWSPEALVFNSYEEANAAAIKEAAKYEDCRVSGQNPEHELTVNK